MDSGKPVFMQIVEMVEDQILDGTYQAGDMIISTTQISKLLSVNPTTSVKAVGILAEKGLLSKKRGLGMVVTEKAKDSLLDERKKLFHEKHLPEFIKGAEKIGIPAQAVVELIKERYDD